jgi:hypothetical protein
MPTTPTTPSAERWGPPARTEFHFCKARSGDPLHCMPRHKLPDWWRDDGTCSFCGSITPDAFFELALGGVELIPTDKPDLVRIGYHKLRFQHFGDGHIEKFIAMVNTRKARVAFPGHFYVLPFFCSFVPDP